MPTSSRWIVWNGLPTELAAVLLVLVVVAGDKGDVLPDDDFGFLAVQRHHGGSGQHVSVGVFGPER